MNPFLLVNRDKLGVSPHSTREAGW
jgi:hypothetical protein